MPKYVVLVAGGKGLRMGGEIPKQFMPIGGMPVLMRTMLAFRQAVPEAHLVLVLPHEQQDYWRQLCRQYRFEESYDLADGGETRFHSVLHGLALLPDDADGVVAVHDGVRPFVSPEVVRRCFDAAQTKGAVIPVIAPVETVRRVEADGTSVTVDRSVYRLVQTPQVFSLRLLKEAYRQTFTPEFTDDASVVERLGHRVTLVEGDRRNIKITTPEDLDYAEYLCRE